jgi:hypothetical protein
MGTKAIAAISLKVIALTLILFLCYTVASAISGISSTPTASAGSPTPTPPPDAPPPRVDAGSTVAFVALLVAFPLQAVVLTHIILRSRWSGWKLVGAVFLALYGLGIGAAQVESAVNLPCQFPHGPSPELFEMGTLTAALFSPLAVLVLGKMGREPTPQAPNLRLAMPPGESTCKLAAIAVAYPVLNLALGYFIVWKNPAAQAYCDRAGPGGCFAQFARTWVVTPWTFPLQVLRALLWTASVLPVIEMLKGRSWEVALTVALLAAVWSGLLLLSNPYVAEAVAQALLLEAVSSGFVFGGLVGWLISASHTRCTGRTPAPPAPPRAPAPCPPARQ